MKLYLFIILTLVAISVNAQTNPTKEQPFNTIYGEVKFNTPFYDLEDHWVAAARLSKNTYVLGMVYLDTVAGYKLKVEGTFQVDSSGHVFRAAKDYRPATAKVSTISFYPGLKMVYAIPDAMLTDLKVPAVPEWLKSYHSPMEDRNSDSYKITRGRYLNAAGSEDKAIEYLEPVYATNQHAPLLEYELSYAYNRLNRFTDAQTVAKTAIAFNPQNPNFYSELGFAYVHNKDYDNAIKTLLAGKDVAKQKKDNFCQHFIIATLGSLYLDMQQYDKAINLINDFLPESLKKPELYNILGMVYEKTGDYENVIKTYTKGIESSPPAFQDRKAQMAYSMAILYRDKLNNKEQYIYWGRKTKEWAVNTSIEKLANELTF